MRVLTVRQPWAWAIVHGGKDVENRSRNIAGGYRGPVAIHAGLRPDLEALATPEMVGRIATWRLFAHEHEWFSNSPRGHIIGIVDLAGVHWSGMECLRSPDAMCHEYEQCSPWGQAYHHHLVLTNARALATPIPTKGRLGLWRPDDALEAAIREQVQR